MDGTNDPIATAGIVLTLIGFFVSGALCTFTPRTVQNLVIRMADATRNWPLSSLRFEGFIRSTSYATHLRFTGIFIFIFSTLLLYGIARKALAGH
jgi:hypothetical protein